MKGSLVAVGGQLSWPAMKDGLTSLGFVLGNKNRIWFVKEF